MNDTEKLQEESKKLHEALDAKSDLISITAHQLRTSLCALKWTIEMLHQKDLGEINKEQEEYLGKALVSNERMITLVNQMLSFNHADEPVIAVEKQTINTEKLLNEIIFEFSGETRKKNITLTLLKPSSDLSPIEGDPGMVRVVLESVVENAIKYSSEHGVVSISTEMKNEGKAIGVAIHNDGIGIADSDKPHIFEKFFRTKDAKMTESFGSGLGLFIARSMLTQYGGTISFESTPENGTTFSITIPIA
jgi:signal transduction histidine kinase